MSDGPREERVRELATKTTDTLYQENGPIAADSVIIAEIERALRTAAREAVAATEREIERLRRCMDRQAEAMHPDYGPCDSMGTDGTCAACEQVKQRAEEAERMQEELTELRAYKRDTEARLQALETIATLGEGRIRVDYKDVPEEDDEARKKKR